MAVDNRSTSALFKRAEQLRRWQESETNRQEITDRNRARRVNFSDGCVFLAACAAGDKQEVLRLLEKGADIDTANVDGLTALHAACIDDNLDMVEFLVDQGADVNRGDMEGWTPLHATSSCGFNSIAKFLIDRGADLSLVNNDGDLAIDIADSDQMENLLQEEIESRGIDCDASRNEEERRMLEDAQRWLSAGYLADRPHPKTGAMALHVAAAKGYINVMSLLLEAGADINAQDLDGWTPLHAAAHWGQRDAVEILCENLADMEMRNFVGQSAFDVADSSLILLMEELKRKQAALKIVNQNKLPPRKRKTSPHREHSNKKEREDQRESDGTSGDESSSDVDESSEETTSSESSNSSESPSEDDNDDDDDDDDDDEYGDGLGVAQAHHENVSGICTHAFSHLEYLVEKKNKVNKENAVPQIIPTSVMSDKNNKLLPQARADSTTMDDSEVQSWRRPSSVRKSHQEDRNTKEDVPRTISSSTRVNSKESEDGTWEKKNNAADKAESSLSATRGRLKARSCPTLSQLEEEGGRDGGGGGGGVQVLTSSALNSSSSSSLVMSQRLSSSDLNLPTVQNQTTISQNLNTSLPIQNTSSVVKTPSPAAAASAVEASLHNSSSKPSCDNTPTPKDIINQTSSSVPLHPTKTNNLNIAVTMSSATTTTQSLPQSDILSTLPNTSDHVSYHKPLGASLSSPVISCTSSSSSSSSASVTNTSSTTTTTTAGLASFSTNQTNNNKDPRLLARSASLRERIQRNHVDSMAVVSTSIAGTVNASPAPPARSIGRSFVPPSRDEESETQRKAHAKMVRSTRRSTQGVTLEDIKSAEQLMKNKQQQQQASSTSSPESKESSSSTPSVSTTSIAQSISTTTTTSTSPSSSPMSKPKPESPTKADGEERRPSWRLKLDESDKNKFSLENVRSKDKSEEENDENTQTVTVQLRKKNSEERGDEEKENERTSQTREGTQAAIQRRKKPKRRSTGRVQVDIDEIDPEKRAQRLLAEQQQQQAADDGSEEDDQEEDSSVSERGEASKGSTSSLGSTHNSRPTSRASSVGPENGDVDYKRLYEEQLEENFRVNERLRDTESELRQARDTIDVNNKKNNTRLAMAEADKREKRALERKLSEMEEELKMLEQLRQENQRLKDENGALIRVISKLSK